MKTHQRFEFVRERDKASFEGNTIEEVFYKFTDGVLGATLKTKGKLAFEFYDVKEETPDVNEKDSFYDKFFKILQEHKIGTWKWYDSLVNDDFWRYDPTKNDFVRRIGKGKNKSPEAIEKSRQALEKSHEARRNNPELAHAIAVKAGLASGIKGRNMSAEERALHGRQMRDGRMKMWANMTEEEKLQKRKEQAERMKKWWDARKANGTFIPKSEKQENDNSNSEIIS